MRNSIIGSITGIEPLHLGRPPAPDRDDAREPHMAAALEHLRATRAELQQATPNKGGYRGRAIKLVDDAIHQVQEGAEYSEHRH